MVSFSDISKLFAYDLQGKECIEIEFMIEDDPHYRSCWMGKTPDRTDKEKELFWFGLVYDGSESYAFDNFETFANTAVFDDKSLKEVWPRIRLLSIDGCSVEWRLPHYLD